MNFEKISEIIADVMDVPVEEISKETRFSDDLGCDSLDVMEIVMEVEKTFQIQIPDGVLKNITTVGDVEELLQKM